MGESNFIKNTADDTYDTDDTDNTDDTAPSKLKKRRLLSNFIFLCCIWLFNFTAFNGLQNLQAAMNAGTGILSLAAVTIGGVISCSIAPTIICCIGSKGALIISCFCQIVYVVANYYPEPYVLITSGGITGLGSGLMWTVQGCYITSIGYDYHKLTNETLDAVLSKLFGIFFMFFQSTQIWGNLISSVVFQYQDTSLTFSNDSYCGSKFCPSNMMLINVGTGTGNDTMEEVTSSVPSNEIILISIYLAFTIISLFIVIFALRPIQSSMAEKNTTLKKQFVSSWRLLVADLNIFLVLPIFLYAGIELVVMYVQYTTSFVACKIGFEWIGYTMLCFGICDTIGSLLFGILGKYTGRVPLFLLGTLLNLGTICLMRFWIMTDYASSVLFFIIPSLWGICDAIWLTQSQALVGTAFHKNPETTFAICIMFQAIGSAIAFVYNIYLCESVKLYIVAVTMIVSVSLVFYLEIRIKHKQTSMVKRGGFPNRTSIEDKFLKDDDIDIKLEEYEE